MTRYGCRVNIDMVQTTEVDVFLTLKNLRVLNKICLKRQFLVLNINLNGKHSKECMCCLQSETTAQTFTDAGQSDSYVLLCFAGDTETLLGKYHEICQPLVLEWKHTSQALSAVLLQDLGWTFL